MGRVKKVQKERPVYDTRGISRIRMSSSQNRGILHQCLPVRDDENQGNTAADVNQGNTAATMGNDSYMDIDSVGGVMEYLLDDVDDNPEAHSKPYYVPGETQKIIDRNSKECPLDFPNFLVGTSDVKMDDDETALMSLMIILRKAGCPKYLFNSILAWTRDTYSRCGSSFFEQNHRKRNSFIQRFSKKGFDFPKPTVQPVALEYTSKGGIVVPESEKTINTVVFDFISQLQRVLQDEKATRQENTILDKEDPYKPYVPNSKIQNIQDGDVFRQTVAKYKDDPEAFVVGLIAYMDKTHATGDERFTAEPVVMVPSFFKEEEMRKPSRQIILGMITDMERKSSAAKQILDKGSPCRNYHAQLSVILQALISIHERGGLWMKLRLHGIVKVVRLMLPVVVLKGDGKSQDNITGRYASHHKNVGRLSWCCNIKPRDARYPWHECQYIEVKKIHSWSLSALGLNKYGEPLREQEVSMRNQHFDSTSVLTGPGDREDNVHDDTLDDDNGSPSTVEAVISAASKKLHEIGQYAVDSSFGHIYMGEGMNKQNGIFSATCCDVLHTLKSGIMKYIMIDFLC